MKYRYSTETRFDYLYKLQPKALVKTTKEFIVCAIETIMINNQALPVMIGFHYNAKGNDMCTTFTVPKDSIDFKGDSLEMMSKGILFLHFLSKHTRRRIVYYHKLSSFDGLLLLNTLIMLEQSEKLKYDLLIMNGEIYRITLIFNGKDKLEIKSSYKMLPFSISKLAPSFVPELGPNNDFQPTLVTKDNYAEKYEAFKTYLHQDLLLTYHIVHKYAKLFFDKYRVNVHAKASASGVALSLFTSNFYDYTKNPIKYLSGKQESDIRKSFYGGHVDVYQPNVTGVLHYDVNSLYPSVMRQIMPTGTPIYLNRNKIMSLPFSQLFGFFYVTVQTPNIERPILPYRTEKNLEIYPVGTFKGYYFSEEIKNCITYGYKFTIHEGYHYPPESRSYAFKEFVETLYAARLVAKQEQNSVFELTYKLLLNSFFGRLGINKLNNKVKVLHENELENFLVECDVIEVTRVAESQYVMVKYHVNEQAIEGNKTLNVACASAIAAYARIEMSEHLMNNDVAYTDTDSVFVRKPLLSKYLDKSKLGFFKLVETLENACFIAPKTYFTTTTEGKTTVKSAGLSNLTSESILKGYKGEALDPKVVKHSFLEKWRALSIFTRNTSVKESFVNNKRLNVYDKKGNWVSTTPIIINER